MNQELSKKNLKELLEIEGDVRGVVFKTDGEYILKKKGREGLSKLERELKNLDQPIKYQDIETLAFYPVGLRVISLLVIKRVFNFDNEEIKEMGFFATKTSLLVKLFIKYFLSIQRVFFKEASKIWRKHWSIGEIKPIKLDEEKKYALLQLKDFSLHPIYCCYLEGYFRGILQMITKSSQITCEETKCYFRGDKYHEYLIKWK